MFDTSLSSEAICRVISTAPLQALTRVTAASHSDFDDESFERLLSACPNLTSVKAPESGVTDEGLKRIEQSGCALRTLNLRACGGVTSGEILANP
jgi:hypothetical protein